MSHGGSIDGARAGRGIVARVATNSGAGISDETVPVIDRHQAAAMVRAGDRIIAGGFGMTGHPVHLLDALSECATGALTYIGNNVGEPGLGGGKLLRNGQIKKAVGSYFTSNPEAVAAAQRGDLEVELLPQGSLAEAIRAGGAGLGGFFTPTAANTVLADGREARVIDGVDMVFVAPIRAEVAFIRAWRADTAGNLCYRLTESNFTPRPRWPRTWLSRKSNASSKSATSTRTRFTRRAAWLITWCRKNCNRKTWARRFPSPAV